MARKEQLLPATWEDIPAGRQEQFKALEKTSTVFEDVPVEELEREVSRALRAVRERRRHLKSRPVRPP